MAARGFLGAGDLYISTYNASTGTFDGFKGPFEATKFEIKPKTDLKEMSSRGRTTYGQVIESVALAQPAEFQLDMPEINKDSLKLALLGSNTVINQGSGTANNQPVVVAAKDTWLDLGKVNWATAGFVVTDVAGTTTYVQGTDYEINYMMGWLKILPGSAIVAASTVHVDGTYNATSGTSIAGGTQAQIRAQFRLDGVNFADGQRVLVDVWEAVIASDNAFDFLADKFASLGLKGKLKTPVGKTEPFKVQLLDAA